ncbi:MAG: HD domain-containing protein, partial [Actinomycetota bacterium]|nr:HD domain-containing protein [Actinomycetota bacterium]
MSEQGSGRPPHAADRWREHRLLAGVVRAVVLVTPVLAAVVAAAVATQLLPEPGDGVATFFWLAAVVLAAVVAYLGVERAARALLPLAVLLKLSLLFPDRAPSRLRMVWHVGSGRHLAQLTAAARLAGRNDDRTRTAELLVEMIAALGRHDPRTRGHSERVRAYTDLITCEMRLPEADRDRIRWAALVHDLGKLVVPTTLLNKPGAPSASEWDTLRRHPAEGARLAAALLPWLGEWGRAVDEHHERWDGSGYPLGLAGEQIGRGARIVAVADAFEVMTAVRAYKKAMSAADARCELVRCAGTQFDPVAVRGLMAVSLGRLRWVMGPAAYVVALPFASFLRHSGPRLRHASSAAAALVVAGLLGVVPHHTGPALTLGPAHGQARAAGAPSTVPAASAAAAPPAAEGPTSVLGQT